MFERTIKINPNKQIQPTSLIDYQGSRFNRILPDQLSSDDLYLFNGVGIKHKTQHGFESYATIDELKNYDESAAGLLIMRHIDTRREFADLEFSMDRDGEVTPTNGSHLQFSGRMGRTALHSGYLSLPKQP